MIQTLRYRLLSTAAGKTEDTAATGPSHDVDGIIKEIRECQMAP